MAAAALTVVLWLASRCARAARVAATSGASPSPRPPGGAALSGSSRFSLTKEKSLALSVASNIETDGQTQPSDVLCLAYNAVLAALHNTSEPKCKYVMHGYYGGYCDCGNNYQCGGLFKKQCRLSEYGSLSKADCEASCIK